MCFNQWGEETVSDENDLDAVKISSESIQSSLHWVVAYMLDCIIVVSEFELQLRYYIHFQINSLGKGLNTLYSSPAIV